MKAHNIAPKGALVGGATPASGASGTASSPTAPKKRPVKKRKVQAESDEDDDIPEVKQEVKKEAKPEKKVKDEAKHYDDGSFMLSDIPKAPSSRVKQEADCDNGVGAVGYGVFDVRNASVKQEVVKQEPVIKNESGSGHEHAPSPRPQPRLEYGEALFHPMTPSVVTQSFEYETNSDFQSLMQAQTPSPMTMIEPSDGSSDVFLGGNWLLTGPRHYYWDENTQV